MNERYQEFDEVVYIEEVDENLTIILNYKHKRSGEIVFLKEGLTVEGIDIYDQETQKNIHKEILEHFDYIVEVFTESLERYERQQHDEDRYQDYLNSLD